MNSLTLLLRRLYRLSFGKPPVIPTKFGEPVTESARLQAAINMALDPALKLQVEQVVITECGGDVEKGIAECKRRYPEAYFEW